MRVSQKRRSGFTLAEVLVTVSIVAILSAVVVPSVVRQIDKGDTGRIAQDVSNIRVGVEQFVSDVRKYPGDVGQLTHAIAGATDVDLVGGTAYTTNQQARWKGPYVSKDSVGMLKTGFGWAFLPQFFKDTFALVGTTVTPGLAIETAATLDSLQILALDSAVDDANILTGSLRYEKSGTAKLGKLKVLLVPIQ